MFNPTSASALMVETPISPLCRRMIEDMTVRKFEARTQENYIRAVKGSSAFLGAPPDTPRPQGFTPLPAASGGSSTGPATAAQMAPIDKGASPHMLRRS